MTHDEALAWAQQWIAEWNRRDVDAVLAHFADDVEFCSPLVVTVTGEPSGVVRGKDALRAYWTTALESRPDLHFELDDVTAGVGALSVHYRSAGRHSSEVAVFDADGLVSRGWALYGAA
jgi:ketosteroid isomerase-like protein